jgi:hypothetical protein
MIETLAKQIDAKIFALPSRKTDDLRRVRKEFSQRITELGGSGAPAARVRREVIQNSRRD